MLTRPSSSKTECYDQIPEWGRQQSPCSVFHTTRCILVDFNVQTCTDVAFRFSMSSSTSQQKESAVALAMMRRRGPFVSTHTFGAFCLDVRTLTFCQLIGFPLNHWKFFFFLAGEQKATEIAYKTCTRDFLNSFGGGYVPPLHVVPVGPFEIHTPQAPQRGAFSYQESEESGLVPENRNVAVLNPADYGFPHM